MKNLLFSILILFLPVFGFGQLLSEGFDDITTLPGSGWTITNQSNPIGINDWFQGNDTVFPSHSGAPTSYIGANYNSTAGNGTISSWLITPVLSVKDGDEISFWTRTAAGSIWNDRLEVRMSQGAMTLPSGEAGVGSFTTTMLIINDGYDLSYPEVWTLYEATVSGVGSTPVSVNFAFRYNVVNGGPSGSDSNYIGIDDVLVEGGGGGGSDYCIPEGTNSGRYIDNFSTTGGAENVNNLGSGFSPGGYGDFHETMGISQAQGESVDFTADFVGGTFGFRAWVDWNQDGAFDTTTEVVYQSNGYLTSQSGSISVPADAMLGTTRMRIVNHWLSTTGDVDPCATGFTYGEFEDYYFTVTEGSGGGECTPEIEINQNITNVCMANLSQGGLAQSYIPLQPDAAGAGLRFEDIPASGLNFTLSLWDNLPNAGGTMLATKTVQTDGSDNWVDVFWDSSVSVTVGSTYYIVIEGDVALPCISGSTTDVYPDGMVFANVGYTPFPDYDYTFRTYYCSGGGGGTSTCLTSLFAGGNNGSPGGAVYFDVAVGADDIQFTGLDMNTDNPGASFTVSVYTLEGTYAGNEGNAGAWTLRSNGTGTSNGTGVASHVDLDTPFAMNASTTYGVALVLSSSNGHYYTNGDGTNQTYTDGNITLNLGSASNVPFDGSPFSPRVFNGSVCYTTDGGGGPTDPCDSKIVMECGVTYTASLVPSAGEWVNYTGVSYNYTGSEQVFEFTAPTSGDYLFEPDQGTADADFMVMDACSNTAGNILGSGYWTGLTNQPMTMTAGQKIFIIADLYSGASSGTTVSIKVTCPTAPPGDCEQDFMIPGAPLSDATAYPNGKSILMGTYEVANDVVVPANSSFAPETVNIGLVLFSGVPDTLILQVYGDDGSGGVGAPFGPAYNLSSSDFVATPDGNWNGAYPAFLITIDTSTLGLVLENTSGSDVHYWLGVQGTTSTADNVFWLVSNYVSGSPSNPTWFHDGIAWSVSDGGIYEGAFKVEGSCETLGISEISTYEFAYYPNPVKDVLNITSEKAVESVSVFNMAGQKVIFDAKLTNGQINLNALSPGAYVFRVILEGNKVETFKVIKK